jgi:hypothetical protein
MNQPDFQARLLALIGEALREAKHPIATADTLLGEVVAAHAAASGKYATAALLRLVAANLEAPSGR